MKPLIIISPDERPSSDGRPYYYLKRSYSLALTRAGAVPVMAADPGSYEAYAEFADGLVLTDGVMFISPGRYGSAVDPKTGFTPFDYPVSPARDARELCLLKAFIDAKKPVLGIGRGMCLINALFGGTLRPSGSDGHPENLTRIMTADGTYAEKLWGRGLEGVVCCRDSIKDLGKGLYASAFDESGSILGLGHEDLPVIGVMWHPEPLGTDLIMYSDNKEPGHAAPASKEETEAMRARAVTKEPDPSAPSDRGLEEGPADPLFSHFARLCAERSLHG